MDYSRPERADRLAAEYVLGTLQGRARRRFDSLLPAHPRLRDAVHRWEDRLLALATSVPAVPPSPQIWTGIEERLFGATAATNPPPRRWWQVLGLWQGWAGVATAASVALVVALSLPPPVQPPVVVVLAPQGGVAASYVASVSADGRSLVLKPVQGMTVASNRTLELWAVPPAGAPRSLGVVAPDRATTVLKTQLLKGVAAFALSEEPSGGSPTGAPTGPVVSVGKLEL